MTAAMSGRRLALKCAGVLFVDPATGALVGGADPRRDGYAMGW